jgi:5-methylcytosine-specific restriction endonuclease McrA
MIADHIIRNGGCKRCKSTTGRIETKSGQDCVYCTECGAFQYNAPRTETGREVRSLRTRPDISPSQRTRILDRDGGTCILCHSSDRPLDIGHLISVDDGNKIGLTEAQIYHDDNLAAMCAPCNSGYGSRTVNPRIIAAALAARALRSAIEGAA